ncbi:hypothetical protein HYT52_03095 [Candidatus Woesearchaeota archaeon]|nr:hypothetical protein [Candidatus Woesearchaeota archaeon]
MKHKHLSQIIVLLLLVGSVLTASAMAETDKVMVVTYDSADEMLLDLNKVKTTLEKSVQKPKTWTYCHRYNCYQVELAPVQEVSIPVYTRVQTFDPLIVSGYELPTKVLTPVYVQTYTRPEPVSKYRYNPADGVYVNEWDEKEERYRHKYYRHRYDRDRWYDD